MNRLSAFPAMLSLALPLSIPAPIADSASTAQTAPPSQADIRMSSDVRPMLIGVAADRCVGAGTEVASMCSLEESELQPIGQELKTPHIHCTGSNIEALHVIIHNLNMENTYSYQS